MKNITDYLDSEQVNVMEEYARARSMLFYFLELVNAEESRDLNNLYEIMNVLMPTISAKNCI